MEELTLKETLQRLRDMKEDTRLAKKDYEEKKRLMEAFQHQVWEMMYEQDHETVINDGTRFSRTGTVFAHVTDEEKFYEWCVEHDLVDVYFTNKPRGQSLNEHVRSCITEGQEPPPGVTFYERRYVSVTENG